MGYFAQIRLSCFTLILFTALQAPSKISKEQTVKLRQCLSHIDKLEAHKRAIEQEIFGIAEPFSAVLDLLYTLPGLDKNPMTAIAILSEIGSDGF